MRFLLISALLLTTTAALAVNPGSGDDLPNLPSVQYISWCVKNQIFGYDSNGVVQLRLNCADTGHTCRQFEKPVGGGVVSYAQCK